MVTKQKQSGRARVAFTIVEMVVSMALVLFIMVILSEAFTAGLGAFRTLKALGDMNERLRSVTNTLRRDLLADHFGNSMVLSAQTLPLVPPTGNGFFRIWHGSPLTTPTGSNPNPSYANEGSDADGMPCARAADHMMHFSIHQAGSRQDNFFTAKVSDGSYTSPLSSSGGPLAYRDSLNYNSPWAEVAYFLRRTGTNTTGTPTTPLYGLYRRQNAVVPLAEATANGWNTVVANRVASSNLVPYYVEVSANQDPTNASYIHFNTETDITMPVRRFGMKDLTSPPTTDQPNYAGLLNTQTDGTTSYPIFKDNSSLTSVFGADLLLTDVTSFEVKVLVTGGTDFVDLFSFDGTAASNGNPAFSAATGPRVFDTWTTYTDGYYDYSTSMLSTSGNRRFPLNITIKAVQITLRVWDLKTQASRQVTIRQDM